MEIFDENAGGICGKGAGFYGTMTIDNCQNTAEISGENAGGICGQGAGFYGTMTIDNCHNTAEISGHSAGGICGQGAGRNGSKFIIKHCSNTGNISGCEVVNEDETITIYSAGGICGRDAGLDCSTFLIRYCWNEGNIEGDGTGGICGIYSGSEDGDHRIEYCYNSGDFYANNAGGIFGRNARATIIFNCYNTGTIQNKSYTAVGGIVGLDSGDAGMTTRIYHCYSNPGTSDYWGGDNTGGIAASKSASGGHLEVYNSYYVDGNTDINIYGDTPDADSNTSKTSIW